MHKKINLRCKADGTEHGFTLIELLITIAIIGILSAIAYPYYGEFVTKTRRSDAQVALLSQVQAMERCKATNYSYTGCDIVTTSPEGYYTLELDSASSSATAFTIVASGVGVQANDSDCATMSINSVGSRTATNSSDSDSSSECWAN